MKSITGQGNTTTNLEHRMAAIFHNAGLNELKGGLHIFRRTFATRMYEKGARTKEIAAYIGDLESTTEKYYIAMKKSGLWTAMCSRLWNCRGAIILERAIRGRVLINDMDLLWKCCIGRAISAI